MDRLWSPWRYKYVTKASADDACIFCVKAAQDRDEENYIVYRGQHCFVILNAYPYSSGHVMVAPYEHVSTLEAAHPESLLEMMRLTADCERHIRAVYRPRGLNIGMNIGEAAGAGVVGHIHMHVLPRWVGDTNFMTTVAETRVLPELLEDSYAKLRAAFSAGGTQP